MTHPHERALEAAARAVVNQWKIAESDMAAFTPNAIARAAVTAYQAALQETYALAEMSDDDAFRLSADIYDGMLSGHASLQSELSGSFQAETESQPSPGGAEESPDQYDECWEVKETPIGKSLRAAALRLDELERENARMRDVLKRISQWKPKSAILESECELMQSIARAALAGSGEK